MVDFPTALLSGLGSGLVVAGANYWFTRRQIEARDRKEYESYRCQRIEDLVDYFEDVRTNYCRAHEGKPYAKEFEVRDRETIVLTLIQKELRKYDALLSHPYNELMQKQFKIACDLALAIDKDLTKWNATLEEFDTVAKEISKAKASDFYSKGITSSSNRRL